MRQRGAIGTQFPFEHPRGENDRVDPGQRIAVPLRLLADDRAPGLDRAGIALTFERVDGRRLAGARPAGDYDETIGVGIIYRT
jgi:hypothetical protein